MLRSMLLMRVLIGWACLLGALQFSYSQHPLLERLALPDSLKTQLNYQHNHLDRAFLNLSSAYQTDSTAAPIPQQDSFALRIMEAEFLMVEARYQEALQRLEPIQHQLSENENYDPLIRIYLYRTTGILYSLMGLLGPANTELLKALELSKSLRNPDQLMLSYLELAELSRKRNDPRFTQTYLAEAERIAANHTLSKRVLAYYYNRKPSLLAATLAENYPEEAGKACSLALQYAKEADLPYLLASTHNELGMLKREPTLRESSSHWLEAARIWEEMGAERDLVLAYLNLGVTYLDHARCDSALKYLNKAQETLKGRIWAYLSVTVYRHKARFFETCSTHQDSLTYYLKAAFETAIREGSIWKDNRNFASDFAYQSQQLKQSIEKAQDEIQLANERRDLVLAFSVALTLGLLTIVWMWLRLRQRNRQLKQTLATLESTNVELAHRIREKEILLDEIHHRVKNNFSVILNMLRKHARRHAESQGADNQQVFTELANRISAMASIQNLLYESEDLREITLRNFFEELAEEYMEMLGATDIEVHITCPVLTVPPWQALLLGTLFSELITNSVKHSFFNRKKGNIWLNLETDEQGVVFTYKDNGTPPVSEVQNNASGMGMHILASTLQQLNGKKMRIEGTRERFKFSFGVEEEHSGS